MKRFRLFIHWKRNGETKIKDWRSHWKWRNRIKYFWWSLWLDWHGWIPIHIETNDPLLYATLRASPAYRKAHCKIKLIPSNGMIKKFGGEKLLSEHEQHIKTARRLGFIIGFGVGFLVGIAFIYAILILA